MGYFPAGHGFEFICFLLETRWGVPCFSLLNGVFFSWFLNGGWLTFILGSVISPVLILLSSVGVLFFSSLSEAGGNADWTEYLEIKDKAMKKKYHGKKIPMDIMYEAYMHQKIDMKQDVYETLLRRNELFTFNFSLKYSLRWFMGTFLGQNVDHSQSSDKEEVQPVYDRGNDFYNWFLGSTMIYTSGIFESQKDNLEKAQMRKLNMVCNNVHMKQGDEHLDIGCGWGTLLRFAAKEFGATSTGITLAQNQKEYHEAECKKWNEDPTNKKKIKNANSHVLDYRLLQAKKYDCITCLEMAEHVGIKNFQKFLLQVRSLLKDSGLFYLQIAGLRRTWQYEDLVWGIFMGQYIFPAADASCPIGWVTTQLERAGFEVHRVENCGVHYSLTIKAWYNNWMKNKDQVIEKYGQYWFRMWAIFLAWSAIIAAQGSSTVFMITSHINHKNDGSSVYQADGSKKLFSRMDTFVGPDILGVQQ